MGAAISCCRRNRGGNGSGNRNGSTRSSESGGYFLKPTLDVVVSQNKSPSPEVTVVNESNALQKALLADRASGKLNLRPSFSLGSGTPVTLITSHNSARSDNAIVLTKSFDPPRKFAMARFGRSGSAELASTTFCVCNHDNENNNVKAANNEANESKIQSLFATYAESDEPNVIGSAGIEALCHDLDLRPDEFRVLVLAWKCRAEHMCRFAEAEFASGCRALKVDDVRALKTRLKESAKETIDDPILFKDIYRFAFEFGLQPMQKVLSPDMAVSLWLLLFAEEDGGKRPPKWLPDFLDFVSRFVRFVPKDTWNMFLNLTDTIGDDLDAYDDSEAWPSLFDDFVDYEHERLKVKH